MCVKPGPVLTNHSQEFYFSSSPRFVNLNVTQLLIGQTVWFSQSEVVLHSNAAKYRKIWKAKLRRLERMVGV